MSNWSKVVKAAKKSGKAMSGAASMPSKKREGGAKFAGANFGKDGKGVAGAAKKVVTAPARALGSVGSRITGQRKKMGGKR